MFQFPGFAHRLLPVWRDRSRRVSPFGHPRVTGHLPLTAAFRSLSRPSSPPRATGIPHAPFLSFLVPSSKAQRHHRGGAPLPYTKRPPSFRMTICSLYVARSRVLTPLLAARTRSLAAAQGGGRRRGNTAGAEQDRSIYIASFSRPAFGSN